MSASASLLERLALRAPHLSGKHVIPAFVYGTAWKKEATTDLVVQALSNGFTAIDTACQPRHYREDLVGEGMRKAIVQNGLKRADLYIQTKFTSIDGQDPNNIPYDASQSITGQVKQSIDVSLKHFTTSTSAAPNESEETYLDTLVLHSPMRNIDDTMTVWKTVESYVPQKIRNIGISNCDLFTLMNVYERSTIKPVVVQNRFYPRTKFDIGLRRFCREKGIIYQSFWTLSANPDLLKCKPVRDLATYLNISRESALYSLVLGLENTVILNGTTNVQHMKDDWTGFRTVKEFAGSNEAAWLKYVSMFQEVIGESSSRSIP